MVFVERCGKRDEVVPDQAGVRLVMNMQNRSQRVNIKGGFSYPYFVLL